MNQVPRWSPSGGARAAYRVLYLQPDTTSKVQSQDSRGWTIHTPHLRQGTRLLVRYLDCQDGARTRYLQHTAPTFLHLPCLTLPYPSKPWATTERLLEKEKRKKRYVRNGILMPYKGPHGRKEGLLQYSTVLRRMCKFCCRVCAVPYVSQHAHEGQQQ